MNVSHAITRRPGADFAEGLTTASLGAPDFDRMLRQHAAYVDALRALGLDVTVLDPVPGYPDAYFTEDVAVLLPEMSVITRPGAPTRAGEIDHIAAALPKDRPIARILPPGTLEGGDVLVEERQVFVGLSRRTNHSGIDQLREILTPYGYTVTAVPVPSGLHLKSGVSCVASGTLLLQPAFSACAEFEGYNRLIVPPGELYAANTVAINGTLLVPKGYPLTYRMLETLDVPLVALETSEVQKMDGGLTCLSLRY
jgi:dimethylargininase